MQTNPEYLLAKKFTAQWEGGKVDDPDDPGKRTNAGVTQKTYDEYRKSKKLSLRKM